MEIFISGIGTDVGKTIASAVFVKALQADYFKPIQAGDLDYSDTYKVKELADSQKSKFYSNAYTLQTPMSPHAAADIDKVKIDIDQIERPQTDRHLIIEGAGGLLVPINQHNCIIDLVKKTDKIILVSRHYLGSINHTLLSHQFLQQRNIDYEIVFVGEENSTTESIIQEMTGKSPIGRIPQLKDINSNTIASTADMLRNNIIDKLQINTI